MERTIGAAAGKVWQTLNKAPATPAQLVKTTGLPADLATQAIGWLAREGKISAENSPKGTILKLKG